MAENVWDKPPPPGASDLPTVAHWVVEQSPSSKELVEQWADRYWLPGDPGQTVLDVGCGNGTYAVVFGARGLHYTGIDISHEMIGMAREKFPDCDFYEGDVTALPFADNSFDYAFTRATLYHLPLEAAKVAIGEMIRVARLAAIVGLFSVTRGARCERMTRFGTYQRRGTLGEDLAMMLEFDPDTEVRVVNIAMGRTRAAEAYYIVRKC